MRGLSYVRMLKQGCSTPWKPQIGEKGGFLFKGCIENRFGMVIGYYVEFRPEALEDLWALDKVVAQRALKKTRWLAENFEDITPEILKGDFKGLFKLRIGDYRVLYTVNYNERKIIIHLVGHRKDVYKQK